MSAQRIAVTVCRGCCCGTGKHPDTDHEAQLKQLSQSGIRVRVADCLDVCEHSNVMVVHPNRGQRPVWLGGVLDEETTAQVARWAQHGGRLPEPLHPFVIDRPARA
jgi:(2Fe-2S) ferredoxin